MENKLIVSLSPHVHGGDSVQKNMYGVLIALIPAFLVSLYFFGLGALIVTATSVAACLFFEWAIEEQTSGHGSSRGRLFVLRMGNREIFTEETYHDNL